MISLTKSGRLGRYFFRIVTRRIKAPNFAQVFMLWVYNQTKFSSDEVTPTYREVLVSLCTAVVLIFVHSHRWAT